MGLGVATGPFSQGVWPAPAGSVDSSTLAVSPKLHGVWQENAQGGPTFYDAYLTR